MPQVDLLSVYLLGGLVAHKAVWEIMKRQQPRPAVKKKAVQPVKVSLVKMVKIGILLAIAVQTVLPPVLPIAGDPAQFRVIGVCVFTAGLLLAILGRVHLGNNWLDIEDAGVKRNQSVVAAGVYRYIRHPIYVGDLILLVGLELALNSWLVLLALVLIPVVLLQAVREENFLRQTLPGYADYCARTKRFIPFLA